MSRTPRKRAVNQDPLHFDVTSELSRVPDAPDLTDAIMNRLGYAQVEPRRARRGRLLQLGIRCIVIVAMVASVFIGVQVFEQTPAARQPAGPTIPAALGSDLHQHQEGLGVMFRTIRNLGPGSAVDDAPRDDDSDGPSVEPAATEDPESLDSAVDQLAVAPVKWV